MALSDSQKLKYVPSVRSRAIVRKTNKHWSDSQKLEVVTTYLALGNVALTASLLKIPEETIRTWRKSQWWKEVESELRVQEELQLSTRLKTIIEATMSATEDRIKNGDYIYDHKTGGLIRKPVNLRDVHRVTMDMVDRRDSLLNRQPVNISIEQVEDKLLKLAEKFAEIAGRKQEKVIEVTDVIIENGDSYEEESVELDESA